MFLEICVLKNFGKFTQKHLWCSVFLFLEYVECLITKKRLQRICFSVNIRFTPPRDCSFLLFHIFFNKSTPWIYLLETSKENTSAMCEICSKLSNKTREQRYFFLNLNRFNSLLWLFHSCFWTRKCPLGFVSNCITFPKTNFFAINFPQTF